LGRSKKRDRVDTLSEEMTLHSFLLGAAMKFEIALSVKKTLIDSLFGDSSLWEFAGTNISAFL
jgi:hypothetical protein